jgi:hypothetical protein
MTIPDVVLITLACGHTLPVLHPSPISDDIRIGCTLVCDQCPAYEGLAMRPEPTVQSLTLDDRENFDTPGIVAAWACNAIATDENENISAGSKPYEARSFSDLHDEVDANDYISTAMQALGLGSHFHNGEDEIRFANAVTDHVDRWLRTRPQLRMTDADDLDAIVAEYDRQVKRNHAEEQAQEYATPIDVIGEVIADELGDVAYEMAEVAQAVLKLRLTPHDFDHICTAAEQYREALSEQRLHEQRLATAINNALAIG